MNGDDGMRRPDLSDEAIFRGMTLEPANPPTAAATAAAVETAIRAMRGANLAPSYGFDMDDAIRLWSATLAEYEPTAIVEASTVWVRQGDEFPTLSEFQTMVRLKHREARAPEPREDGGGCPECGDTPEAPTEGWVNLTAPGEGGTGNVRPCQTCNEDRYNAWKRNWRKPRRGAA